MQLNAAASSFFQEFTKFEQQSVGGALQSLSKDSGFAKQAENLLDFDARLKLLERLAFARNIPHALLAAIGSLLQRARRLNEIRNEVARYLAAHGQERKQTLPGSKDPIPPRPGASRSRNSGFVNLLDVVRGWLPSIDQLATYQADAIALQVDLQEITRELDNL